MLYRIICLVSTALIASAVAQPPAQPPAKRTILQQTDVAASPA